MKLIDLLELMLLILVAGGVALIVGAYNVIAGVGAGLLVAGLIGFVLVIAYEKGSS